MKRFVIILGTLGLILASCAVESEDTNVNSEISTTTTIADTTKSEDEKYHAANENELNVKLSSYGDGVKILTADDIYLQGFDCGYISSIDKSYKLIVDTRSSLIRLLRYMDLTRSVIIVFQHLSMKWLKSILLQIIHMWSNMK